VKNSTRYILIILLLLFGWWLQDLLSSKPELISREKVRFANYFLEDFTLTAHNKEGLPRYSLQAKRLDHFEQESVAEIQTIRAEIFNEDANWTISARRANLYKDNERIEFYDDVKIFRPAQDKLPELSFQAEKMILFTDTETLKTDSHVIINSNGNSIESDGLSYDSLQGILELTANVKVTYVK